MNTDISTSSARVGLAGSLENMKSNVLGRDEREKAERGSESESESESEREEKRGERKRECVCVVLEEEARQSLASDGGCK